MKLLSTFIAIAAAGGIPDNVDADAHATDCLFPTADKDFPAVFNDKFSTFTFSNEKLRSGEFGDHYAEGTIMHRQCPAEGSCSVNADLTVSCSGLGTSTSYPCVYNSNRKKYAFADAGQEQKAKNPRTLFFRKKEWTGFKPANRDVVLCPGFGKKKIVPAADDAAEALCGAKPMVPNSKEEWINEEDKSAGLPSNPKECTIWNEEGTSTTCAVGCKSKTKNPKNLNLTCAQRKYGKSKWQWWSIENGKFRPAGKRLLKAPYWCVPDKDYVPEESSGEGSGEGSGANAIEDADVSM